MCVANIPGSGGVYGPQGGNNPQAQFTMYIDTYLSDPTPANLSKVEAMAKQYGIDPNALKEILNGLLSNFNVIQSLSEESQQLTVAWSEASTPVERGKLQEELEAVNKQLSEANNKQNSLTGKLISFENQVPT